MNTKADALLSQPAYFSPCRTWRYSLVREVNPLYGEGVCTFIGLNPSTADETNDDPTIRRCMNYTLSWGYKTYVMLNLFGYRSTDPRGLINAADDGIDIVGPENDDVIREIFAVSDRIVCAWGAFPYLSRAEAVMALTDKTTYCLGLTKAGAPRHPLYLKKNAPLTVYPGVTE